MSAEPARDAEAAEPEVQRAPPAAAPAGPRTLAETVAGLQRRVGNRGVSRLIQAGALGPRRLARRRVPTPAELRTILFDPSGSGSVAAPDQAAHLAGLRRLIDQAEAEMTPAQRALVSTQSHAGLTAAAWAALSPAEQALREAQAVESVQPSTVLGDPALIDTGPRPGTSDAANITTLVAGARAVFDDIATGMLDSHVGQIFGAANVAGARTRYANARTAMLSLAASGHIVTDRSGYNAEVSLGGLTNSSQIALSPDTIDNPTSRESIVTLVHESMHAGNPETSTDPGVGDRGYIFRPEFPKASEFDKLHNAAHYEVVARRHLGMRGRFSFWGQTFVPAGTTVGGVTAPALTPKQEAMGKASEMYREAWTIGLNLHTLWVRIYRNPTQWNTLDLSSAFGLRAPGLRFAGVMPFWSKVEGLTVHARASINPAGTDPSVLPVTQIDVALSEAVVRRLAQGMDAVPDTEAAANALEARLATAAERAAATTVDAERDLLIELVARDIGSITGSSARDKEVVLRMGGTDLDFDKMLVARPPSAFPF